MNLLSVVRNIKAKKVLKIRIEDALYIMMLESSNTIANAIAREVGENKYFN